MKTKFTSALALSLFAMSTAQAYQPIVRPFHSVRAAGMGDVRYTTGFYEENFYANPARMARNPEWLIQIPKISVEAGSSTLKTLETITKSDGAGLERFSDAVGKPISARVQIVIPAYYAAEFLAPFWAFGVGMMVSTQTVAHVGQNALIDPLTVINAGPAITLARRLLSENRLTVGVTAHAQARGTSGSIIGLSDFLTGTDLNNAVKGGSSLGYDFDFGVSFRPHWTLFGFEYEIGGAVNNIMGGKYNNIKKDLISSWSRQDPMIIPRTYSLGVSAIHHHWFFFDEVMFAIEGTDFGNNINGSIYRNLHAGTEWRYKGISLRGGMNQGYPTAGFGLDLKVLNINLATYAEELGLNTGVMEDRRYAVDIGFEI